jgi:hypothetical protein
MAAIQVGVDNIGKFDPPVTKEKAKEIFMYIEDQKFKTMENIMKRQAYGESASADTTLTLLVEHSKIEDMMYEKYEIEAEDFAKSISHYNLKDDDDIKNLLAQNANMLGQPGSI